MIVRFEETGIFAVKPGRGCKPSAMQRSEEIMTAVIKKATTTWQYGRYSARELFRYSDIP